MEKRKNTQTGRSLLETLSVLVVMAILLLASIAGYNFVIHQWRKQQTVKQISELAVRYRIRPVRTAESVRIKDIYPEAERASATQMKTMDTASGRVSLYPSDDSSSFIVTAGFILNDSCEFMLENGEYDAVLATDDYVKDTEYFAIGQKLLKDFDETDLTAKQRGDLKSFLGSGVALTKNNIIKKICGDNKKTKTTGLVYGEKCPKMGGSWWYKGRCWSCPLGQKEDKRGKCCETPNKCGYCEDDSGYCLEKPTLCHDQPVCDADETKTCVECLKDKDCCGKNSGKICSKNHCCLPGFEWDEKEQKCVKPCHTNSDCGVCELCNSEKKCELDIGKEIPECGICDSTGTVVTDETKVDPCHICQEGKLVLQDSQQTYVTNGHCCKDGEEWLEDRCCIPSDFDETKCAKECTTPQPDVCHQCDDATGEWVPIEDHVRKGCFECISGHPTAFTGPEYPCDTECETCNLTNGQCDPKSEGESCDGDICRQCDGKGSCVLKNSDLPNTCGTQCCAGECSTDVTTCKQECSGTGTVCQECNDSTGEWVSVADGTVPEGVTCKWCQAGQLVDKPDSCESCQMCSEDGTCVADNTRDGTECAACSTCQSGICNSKGTECGTQCCINGCNPNDPMQCKPLCDKSSETDCKKCNDETGDLENVPDGTEVGCMQCIGGELQPKADACTECQECNPETKTCDVKPDGTECQDVCHSCKAGACQLTDPGRTHACKSGTESACCVYGCETRSKQKKWNLCRCPNGISGDGFGGTTNHGLPVDNTDYVDEYENDKDHNRCDGCIWISMLKEYGNATRTVAIPPNAQGTFTVYRDPGSTKPLIGDYKADKVYYKIDNGSWKEATGGDNNIPKSNRERTYYFKNESGKYRKVEVHPNTTYF